MIKLKIVQQYKTIPYNKTKVYLQTNIHLDSSSIIKHKMNQNVRSIITNTFLLLVHVLEGQVSLDKLY